MSIPKTNSLVINYGVVALIVWMSMTGAWTAAAQTQPINVSLSQAKIECGQTVEITVRTQSGESVQASLLKPASGVEEPRLQKNEAGVYRAKVETKENAPDGLYVVHVWAGDKKNPSAVGKASFRMAFVTEVNIAGVVAVKGADDLRDLLSRSGMKTGTDEPEEPSCRVATP